MLMTISHHDVPELIDFSLSFVVVGLLSLTAAPLALTMPRDAAAEVAGHRRHG